MSITDRRELVAQLQAGIDLLLTKAGVQIQNAAETPDQFSVKIGADVASLDQTLADLAPYAGLFYIILEYRIQNGSGTASLTQEGLHIADWTEDSDLALPKLDLDPPTLFESVTSRLSKIEGCIQVNKLVRDLDLLKKAGAFVEVSVRIFLKKAELIQAIGWPEHISVLLYVVADKFLREIQSPDFSKLNRLLVPGPEDSVIVMLGDASGVAKGPNIRICGRDQWASPDHLDFRASEADRKKLRDSIGFRSEECHWEISVPSLSPWHLHVESPTLDRTDVPDTIVQLRDRLSVAFLANRVRVGDGTVECEFRGHKRVHITIPALNNHAAPSPIFRLFSWAYENSSSDKLGIVRQIISLQLGDKASANYAVLAKNASDVLGIAKSNFQLFLRRSVELYFDKRLKVSEFLRQFSEEATASVSELTSELVSNMYKTVGVILGVVIAALVGPKQALFIVFLGSMLYLAYILFILIYWLPSAWWRFRCRVKDYRHSVSELRDVLSESEIERLEGKSFERAQWMFWCYFGLTNAVYAAIGAIAYVVMQFFRKPL